MRGWGSGQCGHGWVVAGGRPELKPHIGSDAGRIARRSGCSPLTGGGDRQPPNEGLGARTGRSGGHRCQSVALWQQPLSRALLIRAIRRRCFLVGPAGSGREAWPFPGDCPGPGQPVACRSVAGEVVEVQQGLKRAREHGAGLLQRPKRLKAGPLACAANCLRGAQLFWDATPEGRCFADRPGLAAPTGRPMHRGKWCVVAER